MNSPDNPTFIIKTLGCKVNQYETQAMRERLFENGFIENKNDNIADFYIINSCTVTHKADKDTRSLIGHFRKMNPNGKIVIAGCYAELDNDRKILMDMPQVSYLIRNSEKPNIANILQKAHSRPPTAGGPQITNFEGRNRAFVKIQDGCNHKCSYCKVRIVRGPSKSRCMEEIVNEVRRLVINGFKEIALTGICMGAWGRDLKKRTSLSSLLEEISCINGFFRIRLSSIEPIYVTKALIKIIAGNDRICKHLHMPLQSGDDKILKRMKRPYTAGDFRKLVQKIRERIHDIALSTDILVGFPGEGNKEFRNTVKLINEIRPSRMHIFSYSRREKTAAADFAYDPDKKRIKRDVKSLFALNKKFSMEFAKRFIGKTQNTIIESSRDKTTGLLAGYTDRYLRVLVDNSDACKNKMVPVIIERVDSEQNAIFARL